MIDKRLQKKFDYYSKIDGSPYRNYTFINYMLGAKGYNSNYNKGFNKELALEFLDNYPDKFFPVISSTRAPYTDQVPEKLIMLRKTLCFLKDSF